MDPRGVLLAGLRQPITRGSEAGARSFNRTRMGSHHRDIHIREGLFSDEKFLCQLSGEVFSIYGPYEEMVSRWLEMDTTVTLVAVVHGRVAGFVMFGSVNEVHDVPAEVEILAIAVEPAMQGLGIGQLLMREIEKKATAAGEKRIYLHTAVGNITAQKLFAQNSYRPTAMKPHFYPRGQDALLMLKEIK
jgi:[ribosomal protein S18]-alanine N-acetyltransferase